MHANPIKIAILGGGPSLKDAPVTDETWSLWGMAWMCIDALDVYFEPHTYWDRANYYPCGEGRENIVSYMNDITAGGQPVFMQEVEPDINNCRRLERELFREMAGREYLESTVGYMLATAALCTGPGDEVGLFGVDLLTDEEWGYQRPNAEFWVGYLRGRGVTVTTPESSALMTSAWDTGRYGVGGAKFIGAGPGPSAPDQVEG